LQGAGRSSDAAGGQGLSGSARLLWWVGGHMIDWEPAQVGGMVVGQVEQDPGRQADRRGMRLLGTMRRPGLTAPVVQRNVGVWLALGLIVVILGLDLLGGRHAELLGLLVGPPILAASFVGPRRTVVVGLVAL